MTRSTIESLVREIRNRAWWDRKVEELSKGMAQKVQFITTVLHEPEMLIFDEPFSGFDPINVELLKKEILELRKKGTTIIFSTHNMASVEEICSHIALIKNQKKLSKARSIRSGISMPTILTDSSVNINRIFIRKK